MRIIVLVVIITGHYSTYGKTVDFYKSVFNYLCIAYCSREWRTDLVPRVCLNRLEKRGYHVTSMTGVGQTCIWTLFRPLTEEEKQTLAPSLQENGKAMECTDETNSNGDMSVQASGCSR